MIRYRKFKKSDFEQIQKLALKAWLFTYKDIYKENTIKKEISKFYAIENLSKSLSAQKAGKELFVIAQENNKILGYAHVLKDKNMWELMRIYVNPDLIRSGIGTKLIERIERWLRQKGVKRYVAYPHIKNKIAKNFYEKKGFKREY